MAKFKMESKFIAPDGKSHFKLYANEGKNGFNLGATLKEPGQKAKTGMPKTVDTEEEAKKILEERVQDALANGYKLRATTGTGQVGRRSSFDRLPDFGNGPVSPFVPAPTDSTPVESTPATAPTATPESAPTAEPEVVPAPETVKNTVSDPSTVAELEELVSAGGGNGDSRTGNGKRRK